MTKTPEELFAAVNEYFDDRCFDCDAIIGSIARYEFNEWILYPVYEPLPMDSDRRNDVPFVLKCSLCDMIRKSKDRPNGCSVEKYWQAQRPRYPVVWEPKTAMTLDEHAWVTEAASREFGIREEEE